MRKDPNLCLWCFGLLKVGAQDLLPLPLVNRKDNLRTILIAGCRVLRPTGMTSSAKHFLDGLRTSMSSLPTALSRRLGHALRALCGAWNATGSHLRGGRNWRARYRPAGAVDQ